MEKPIGGVILKGKRWMIDQHNRIATIVRQLLRRVVLAIVFTVCITALPRSISASGSANPDDLLVVANNAVTTDHLSATQVRDYFLKKRSTWPGGDKALPVNAKDRTLREAFRKKVLLMSADEEQRYWQHQMVRSAKNAPPEFNNPLKAVYKLKGGLSYVFRKDYRGNIVKIVLEIPAG